ncbi:hypothetical protein QWY84_12475 [Aquisalimonas lutea]|uniref:hypothetical protein n=1 Tax=Aquisalimonas lutea TaxID=1327750 RepID=UPI0025B61627|nr:hypothetical protein [Aquisalimonas lutea]MDN3518428.1 hypothetical protein [Aquisalimonas lutea]
MDESALFILILILVTEIAIVAVVLGAVVWRLYRRVSREAEGYRSEKHHLERRRDAYLRFLGQRLADIDARARRGPGTESGPQMLARRFLQEEKSHTEAARDRDAEIWDLRMASTKALIELFRTLHPSLSADSAQGSGNGQEMGVDALRRKLLERDQAVERQRREIQQLAPFRDAWMRLHRHAARESAASATLRETLRGIRADADTTEAIEAALQAHAGDREVLDDYLQATASSYEEANPQQVRHARRRQQRMNRMHQVVDSASSRMEAASQRFPALMDDQRKAISDLETKLERAEQAREVIKQSYSREIQALKKNNRDTENNARSLEKENRRLRQRVRNLIRLTRDDTMPFMPAAQEQTAGSAEEAVARKDAELDQLHQSLRQEQAKNERLETQLKKFEDLQTAIQSTFEADHGAPQA